MCDKDTPVMKPENQHIDPVGLLPKIFSGEASPEEKSFINNWLSADPANRDAYNSFRKLWNFTATVPFENEIDLNKEWQKMDASIGTGRVKFLKPYRILQIAASLLIIATLTFLGIRIASYETVKSASSSLTTVDMIDGTHISLNAGSRITYEKGFGNRHRQISLEGEAFFDVGHNPIPFIINVGRASISVTGTQFNVKAYSCRPEIKVTVTEGNVKIYKTGMTDEINIRAGETGKYDKDRDQLIKINTVNSNDMSWKTRILDFHNTPFSEVADILSTTYHIPVTADTVLNKCLVTVRFEYQDADAVLKVLQSTLNLTVTKKGKRILITGKGC